MQLKLQDPTEGCGSGCPLKEEELSLFLDAVIFNRLSSSPAFRGLAHQLAPTLNKASSSLIP